MEDATKLPTLDIGAYNPWQDQITIEGVLYSGKAFRGLGYGAMVGRVFRIYKDEHDECLTLVRVRELEEPK